jgi:ATP-dependent DNA ligase
MIKPMLAYKVDAKPIDWTKKVYMQPKLDGVRCIIQLNDKGEVYAYSRTGKPWLNIEHILQDLKPLFKENEDVILDGELYNHDLRDDFEKIISLVRKQKPTADDRAESKQLVQFHCYDYANGSENYSTRMRNLVTSDMYSYCVKYVPSTRVYNEQDSKLTHDINLSNSYEGSILRLDGLYQCKRSYNLQKFKDFHDTEATIVGYVDGKGKREGTLGKFLMQDDDGIKFGCPPGKGYNYKDLANMLNNIGDYIGQRATFTYFERTKAGSYRHPLFKTIRNYE